MAFTRKTAFEYLRRAYQNGRLAHAYLVSGPPGAGKRALVSDFVGLLTGGKSNDVFTSPPQGVYLAEPESKSRRIVTDQVRALERALQMQASGGQKKVAILVDADRLQPEAANAFLKTLEEPPNDSILFLLTTMPEVLLDTIRSRCLPLPLATGENDQPSPEEKELVDLLNTVATSDLKGVSQSYQVTRGVQRLLAQIRETIQEENNLALKGEETRYKQTTDSADWLDAREKYFKALTESQYLRERSRLLETLFLWWSDVLRANTGIAHREFPSVTKQTGLIAKKLSTAEILRRIRRLEELRSHLSRNIQEALAIEVAFLSVFAF